MSFTTATVSGMGVRIANVTLAGVEDTYTFPTDTLSVTFNPAGNHTIALTTGGTVVYTLTAGAKESLDGRCIAGRTLYFNGTGALELLILTGTNS